MWWSKINYALIYGKRRELLKRVPSLRALRAAKPLCLNLLDSNRKNMEQMLDLKSANSVKRLLMIKMCTRWWMLKKVKAANVTGGQVGGPRC